MNHTWHIVRKDLRAQRWPLALWVTVLIGKILLGAALLVTDVTGESERQFRHLEILVGLLTGLEYAGIFLVPLFVQGDPLIGTTGFWATRPISGARLMRAKLLGLGLVFGVLPVLVALPWWVGCRLDGPEILTAMTETAVRHFLVAALGLVLAVLTDGLGRFVLWLLALVALVPLTSFNVGYYFTSRNVVISSDLATARLLLGAAVVLAGGAALVVYQFLTRHTVRSVTIAIGTYVAVVGIALWWPWSWGFGDAFSDWHYQRVVARWPEQQAAAAGLQVKVTNSTLWRSRTAKPNSAAQLSLDYEVEGLAENRLLLPATVRVALSWPDGQNFVGWGWARSAPIEGATLRALNLPTRKLTRAGVGQFLGVLRPDVVERLQRDPAAATLTARFTLMEVVDVAVVVVGAGEWFYTGATGERLGFVEQDGKATLVTLVRHRPRSSFEVFTELNNYLVGTAPVAWPSHFLFVGGATRDPTRDVDRGRLRSSLTTRVAGVEIRWETFAYERGVDGVAQAAVGQPSGAQLVRVRYRVLGKFSREIALAPFAPSIIEK